MFLGSYYVIIVITMQVLKLQLTQIGNSRGIRIPAEIIKKYKLDKELVLEEHSDFILLKPVKKKKLNWKETFEAMAKEKEDWSDWDILVGEGLDED